MLMQNRKSLVLQERMYFRNIPLSDWVEHEVTVEDGADMTRLVQDMTIFDKGVVPINDAPRAFKNRCRKITPALQTGIAKRN